MPTKHERRSELQGLEKGAEFAPDLGLYWSVRFQERRWQRGMDTLEMNTLKMAWLMDGAQDRTKVGSGLDKRACVKENSAVMRV